MTLCYLALGCLCIAAGAVFLCMNVITTPLFVLGGITCLLSVIVFYTGRYVEGEAKLINLGNKLVRRDLKPASFIKEYEAIKNSPDLVINKPSMAVLQLVIIAYDIMGDTEKALSTADEMILTAEDKKKNFARLFKTSILYSCGRVEEAEALFTELRKEKLDMVSTALADAILKCDRAMVMGDYKTVEVSRLKSLEQKFPKPDSLSLLLIHYTLGEVYEKTGENEKAVFHYKYAAKNGGETSIKISAEERLTVLADDSHIS